MWCIRYIALMGALLLVGNPARSQDRLTEPGLSGMAPGGTLYPRFEMEYVRPDVHKWYAPRSLTETYYRPWYVQDTQYARDLYTRYVNRVLEGDEWYDGFGRPLGRGWLVYTWEQEQAKRDGSLIRKEPMGYSGFFQNLVVAADGGRYGDYRLMVGDAIHTFFTPLTFFKPQFNGLRLDHSADRFAGSVILSRASKPDRLSQTDLTHVMGGHAVFQVAPKAELGFTYVNAHNVLTQRDFNFGNPLAGTLSSDQNRTPAKVWVRIRDDSPADGRGGATVYQYEIVLVDTAGREIRGSEIGFFPRVEGGQRREGGLVADGSDVVLLEYDFWELDSEEIGAAALRQAAVELVVANDYQVELASDLQTDGERWNPEIIFLTAARARGNVQDESNIRALSLDYGLPTASELIGVDWNCVDWGGLSVQGEAVLNRRHRQYPSQIVAHLHRAVDRAHAAYVNAAYNHYPWGLFLEAFSLAADYSTTYWLVDNRGVVRYKAPTPQVYEFVEDDDDYNGVPEWERPLQYSSGGIAWPGYDENRDFLHDYNQNDNLVPDYEEPFLRFRADRPEFLFGLDMNHNNTVDRFENDQEADYPYRRDHRGYNVYASAHAGPDARLILGIQQMGLISGDGRTRALYLLGTWTRSLPGGRLRLFDFGALVRDDIPDPLYQWVQPVGSVGRMREVEDYLPARDTWKNVLYADWEQRIGAGIRLFHRGKWERLAQRDRREAVRAREGRMSSGFLGMINRAEWVIPVGLGTLEPRFKSEFRRDRPFTRRMPKAASLEETASLLWIQPLLSEKTAVSYFARYGRQLFDSELQVGLEMTRFWMLDGEREEIDQDYRGWTLAIQFINRVGYQGYRLVTRSGVQWSDRQFERDEDERTSLLFLTINAGLD